MKTGILPVALLGVLSLTAVSAEGATYNFNTTFDGTNVSLDAGSDNPDGVSLNALDSFVITLNAAGNDYWEVTEVLINAFVPLDFLVAESGTRYVDILATWYLDGIVQNATSDSNVEESFIHLGAQLWNLNAGLQFDQVVLDINIASTDGPTTLSAAGPDIFLDYQGTSLFFRGGPDNGKIAYVPSAVPLPAGIALYLPLLAAGAFVARRRRALLG